MHLNIGQNLEGSFAPPTILFHRHRPCSSLWPESQEKISSIFSHNTWHITIYRISNSFNKLIHCCPIFKIFSQEMKNFQKWKKISELKIPKIISSTFFSLWKQIFKTLFQILTSIILRFFWDIYQRGQNIENSSFSFKI